MPATGSYGAHRARLPELGGCSQLCCWRGLLWFGAVAQTRPWHQHGAEPVLRSSELSAMHRAEGTPLLAGNGRRGAKNHPCRGGRGAVPAPAPCVGVALLEHEPGSQPRPHGQQCSLAGQMDVAQPKNHSSHGGKVMPAAPGWTRSPGSWLGETCQGCHTRLCHSPLLAAALLTPLSSAEHH